MTGLRLTVTFAAALAVSGCAGPRGGEPVPERAATPPGPSYANAEFDELVRYAGWVAELSAAERLDECQKLLKAYRTDRSLGLRLHLLMVQSITEACGNLGDAPALIGASLPEIDDARLKSLLVFQRETLGRLTRETERRKVLERRVSKVLAQEKKTHRRLKSQASELKSLQKKLDALKAIEHSLDESDHEP